MEYVIIIGNNFLNALMVVNKFGSKSIKDCFGNLFWSTKLFSSTIKSRTNPYELSLGCFSSEILSALSTHDFTRVLVFRTIRLWWSKKVGSSFNLRLYGVECFKADNGFVSLLYKGNFTDADKVVITTLHDKLITDTKLKGQAQANDPQIFSESIFPSAFQKAAMEGYKEAQQSYSSMFEDRAKFNAIMSALGAMLYSEFRNSK